MRQGTPKGFLVAVTIYAVALFTAIVLVLSYIVYIEVFEPPSTEMQKKKSTIIRVIDGLETIDNGRYRGSGSNIHRGGYLIIDEGKYSITNKNTMLEPMNEIEFSIAVSENTQEVYIFDGELNLKKKHCYDDCENSPHCLPSLTEKQAIDKMYDLVKEIDNLE